MMKNIKNIKQVYNFGLIKIVNSIRFIQKININEYKECMQSAFYPY